MMLNNILVCFLVAVIVKEVITQNTENNTTIATPTSDLISANANISADQLQLTDQPQLNISDAKIELLEIDEPNVIIKLYNGLANAIKAFFASEKVITVFHNIGTCMVNGGMEIVTHFVPAPMIPLIASAAGLIIPFEPVVVLRKRMPVTSYRRAFNKAVNSFMGTFDKYKALDVEDPYMTGRFNRRFMNDSPEKNSKGKSLRD